MYRFWVVVLVVLGGCWGFRVLEVWVVVGVWVVVVVWLG